MKPSNVLVAPDGPRVIDFGVARAAERVQLTVTRGAAGTPAYMAPEQARDATQASPASDVFSLGATIVFAATGHPPYQGETVMDILVRLATEPPDLTGLPDELTDLVGGCLRRVPRDRPTNAAILTGLGSFAAEPDGAGHAYLPDSAMALIADYQHAGPGAANGDGVAGEDAAGEGGGGRHGRLGSPGRRRHVRVAHRPARLQLAAGLRPGRRPDRAPARRPGGHACGTCCRGLTGPSGRQRRSCCSPRGPGSGWRCTDRTRWGPPRLPPPPCAGQPPSGTPQVCVSQAYGDGLTVYIVHGSGYPPDRPVTISLAGVGPSPDRPVTDRQGTFSYAIDQGHYFFRGPIPLGRYTAVVTASGERSASVRFQVGTGPSTGPPPGQPPAP